MTRLGFASAGFVGLLLLAACGAAKDPSSAVASANAIADDKVMPSNQSDVVTYPDEASVHETQTIEWRAAPIRHANPSGRLIAILTRGNTVTKIARRGDFSLITFPDPSNPTQRFSGWVHNKVFLPGTEPYPPLGNPQRCQTDSDCGAPVKCSGVASTGAIGFDGFHFCST